MKLYKHQEELLAINPKKYGIFWDCGTGKTLMAIELAKKNNIIPLVICPKGLKTQWRLQIPSSWGLMTKEEFRRDCKTITAYKAIIADEAHAFSNYQSQMSKALAWYLDHHHVEYLWLLTGTPYLSTSLNIWTLGRLLGADWKFHKWRETYQFPIKMGARFIWQDKKDKATKERLAETTKKLGSVIKLTDVADMPEVVEEVVNIELTDEQKKGIKIIKENEILSLPRITREHQVCGGTLKENPYTEETRFKTDKVELVRLFADERKKSIVVCRYNDEIELLKESLKDMTVYTINGETEGRHEILQNFETVDKAVLIVNAACSEGWESATCSAMLFYSMDYSVKNYLQMKARIRRINNPRRLYYQYLITKDTVDRQVYNSVVINKQDFYRLIGMKVEV